MSNRCSNPCNYKSFSFCTPFTSPLKPYTTTHLPLFPIQHSFILIGRRSRRLSSSVPFKVSAQSSSSDLVLIATKEHHDGSFIFRFGDASEVVENDDAVEDIESQTEQESSVVKVLDGGDLDRQVITKTGDSGYDSVEGRLVEVADGIRKEDLGSDIAESETNGTRDLSDYYAESSNTLSDISEKEVLVSQPDADLNVFSNIVESTLDEAKFSVELDEEESSDPNIYLVDETPNIEKIADPVVTLLKGSDDKPVDSSVSVELESTQVSQTEVVDDLDNVEAEDASKSDKDNVSSELESTQVLQTEVMDDLDKVETEDRKGDTEDITPSAFPETMPISDIELTDAANDDVEEDLQDLIVNEGTLIDELPPSNPLDIQLTDAVNEDAEEELQDMDINKATIIDEMSYDQLVVEQPTLDEVSQLQSVDVKDQTTEDEDAEEELQDMNINEATIIDEMSSSDQLVVEQPNLNEVSQLQAVDVKDQTMEDEDMEEELQDMNINEATIIDEMSSSHQLVVEQPTLNDVSQLQSVDVKDQTMEDELQQVMSVSCIEEVDLVVEEEISQSQSTPLELKPTIQVLDIDLQNTLGQDLDNGVLLVDSETKVPSVSVNLEVMDVMQPYAEDESQIVESKDASEGDTQELLPPATMQISDVDMDESLQDMIVSEGAFTNEMTTADPLGAEPTLEVSTTNDMDVKDVDTDERLQDMNISEGTSIDEMPTSDPLGAEPTLKVSTAKYVDVKDVHTDERLQDTNLSEDTLIDEMPTSDPIVAEPTLEVSTSKYMDVKDVAVDGILQDMNVSDVDEMPTSDPILQDMNVSDVDEMPTSDPLEAEPALEVSTAKYMDVSVVDTDERLQDMSISEDTFIGEIPASNPLGAEPTLEVSTTKDMDLKDVDMDERLQDMNIIEGTFVDEMPTSDPLGTEQALEVSTVKYMDVKVVDTDERLQDTDISEGTFIDEMPASDPLGAECNLEVSTTKEMDIKDVDMDERLKDKNINNDTFIDEITTSDPLRVEPTLEVSTTEGLGIKDVNTEERLQDMIISEGTFVDEMPSDPLGAEPTLEVSTTEGSGVKDMAVEAALQLVSYDNTDENSNADVIPVESIIEEEATMKDSDIKVQDATVDDQILQVIGEDAGDSYINDVEESSHEIESQPLQDAGLNHNMLEQCAETDALESSIVLKQGGAHDPQLEAEKTEDVVVSGELAEASEVTALLLAAEAEVEREEIYLTDDFLLSGAALLEHPFKALTGGDDAYFVAGSKWLGVANGVSQWSLEGTGPGVYAQELMRTCEEIVLDTSSSPVTNPVELLCRGVKETNMSGSSNVLIANFNGQVLHVANIGDTGFLIIRHGAVYKKSSPLLHEFHFAVQVDDSDDPLQLVEEYLIEVEVGDIVVSATDGLFDNLYEREITMIVSKSLQAGLKPQEIANILATRAQEVGKSSFVRSPFSDAAQAAGYTGYAGGKPDNVAVIVSLVENRSNLLVV